MKLYIKQKVFSIGDKYNVFDENEQKVFFVKSELFSLGAKLHLYDTADRELCVICRELFSFLPYYHIYENGFERATVKLKFEFFKRTFEVHDKSGAFVIDGDAFGMDFTIISPSGTQIGTISKAWLSWGDCYELNVFDPSYAAFFCALVIAIDECIHNENRD